MNTLVPQAQIQSIQAKIIRIAKDRGATAQQIMTIFLIERAAVRLMTDEKLQSSLVFKGGYVGVRVYNSPRYTTDLDAVVRGLSREEAVQKIKDAMAIEAGDAVWFKFESTEALKAQGDYGGVGLAFRGGLGNPPAKITKAQLIHIDLGIGDPVTPSPRSISTSFTIGEGNLTWLVYPVETILAEKLHAMVVLGDRNSRSKDVYDVHLFLPQANPVALRDAIKATFQFRGDQQPQAIWEVISAVDTSILKRGWATAMAGVRAAQPFEEVYSEMIKSLQIMEL
jgi:hypothetical protein